METPIRFRAWDIDSSEMVYTTETEWDNRDFFFHFSDDTLKLYTPVEDDYPEERKIIMMEYTKLKDVYLGDIYDLDVVELTHSINSRYFKGDRFVVYYDSIHNRFGAAGFEEYGAENTGFRSHFFITPANVKKLKVISNLPEMGIAKTINKNYS